jgi:hypothetical protein
MHDEINPNEEMPTPEKKEWSVPTLKQSKVSTDTANSAGQGVDGTGSATTF